MKARGLSALIVDLRFNPGGLLTEAVSVANVFIDSGTIVSTEGAGARQDEVKSARPGRALLAGIPVRIRTVLREVNAHIPLKPVNNDWGRGGGGLGGLLVLVVFPAMDLKETLSAR